MKSILFYLIFLTVLGCVSQSKKTVKTPLPSPDLQVIGGFNPDPWQPFLAIAPVEEPDTTIQDRIRAHQESKRFFRAFMTQFTTTEATAELWSTMWKSINTFDVAWLYRLGLPDRKTDNDKVWRRFAFRGGRIGDEYLFEVRRGQPGSADNWPNVRPFASFGQTRGALSLRPTPWRASEDYYLLHFGSEVDVGKLSWEAIIKAATQTLQLLDISVRKSKMQQTTPALRQACISRFPELNFDSTLLMSELLRAYPHTLALLPRYYILENLVMVREGELPWTKLNIKTRLNRAYLESRYPALSNHLTRLQGLLETSTCIKDANDHVLWQFSGETTNFSMQTQAAICRGQLVPLAKEQPLLKKAVDLQTHHGAFYWEGNTVLHLSGLDLELSNIRFQVKYHRQPGHAVFTSQFSEIPQAKASGALFGFIPVWVVDMLIPSNIEGLAIKFFQTLAQGNNGRGLVFHLAYNRGATQGRIVMRISAEIEDSGFFGFITRLFRSRVVPDAKRRSQWQQVVSTALNALRSDFELLTWHFRSR